eukprot:4358698-Pyramimonas_sp.AAC.1
MLSSSMCGIVRIVPQQRFSQNKPQPQRTIVGNPSINARLHGGGRWGTRTRELIESRPHHDARSSVGKSSGMHPEEQAAHPSVVMARRMDLLELDRAACKLMACIWLLVGCVCDRWRPLRMRARLPVPKTARMHSTSQN